MTKREAKIVSKAINSITVANEMMADPKYDYNAWRAYREQAENELIALGVTFAHRKEAA
jgi:hypothetical protein